MRFVQCDGKDASSCVIKTVSRELCGVALSLFHRAQATRTNVDCLAAFQFHLANVGLPASVGFAVGVRNVLTENNALATDTTFCHFDTS